LVLAWCGGRRFWARERSTASDDRSDEGPTETANGEQIGSGGIVGAQPPLYGKRSKIHMIA